VLAPRDGLPLHFCPRCGRRAEGVPAPAPRPVTVASEGISGWGIAALVVGIVGLLTPCGIPVGLAAIFMGVHARMKIEASRGRLGGGGMATAGIVLGAIDCALWAVVCAAAESCTA
jgi:hypothetical protein